MKTINWITYEFSEALRNPASNYRNYCYYYIFSEENNQDFEHFSQCLTVAEMNFYLNSVPKVAQIVKTQVGGYLAGHDFIGISLIGDSPYAPDESILHIGDFTYAIPHPTTPPTGE